MPICLFILFAYRAVRSERLIHAATEFVYRVLGKKFLRDESPDLQTAASQASAKIPGFLLFTNGKSILNRGGLFRS